MGEEGEGEKGRGVWKPCLATLVDTEQLLWEVAEDDELGKEWVNSHS